MKILRVILNYQLSETISALRGIGSDDVILFHESIKEATYVKHHPQKIAFLFAAGRHFASDLDDKGYQVRYIALDNQDNTGDLTEEVRRAIEDIGVKHIIITEPYEYRIKKDIESWEDLLGVSVEIRADDRFFCSREEFSFWAKDKKQLRMEYFYREMRKKYHILLEGKGMPVGGKWNYDKENRSPPIKGLTAPQRIIHKKSPILIKVLELVAHNFSDHFGTLNPFDYAVTRDQALLELDHFTEYILPDFGEYQDAMVRGEPYLYHSVLSSYMNAGLLLPLEVCQKAEMAYRKGKAPLNSVEGFIRQILGWREYVRGIYWLKMPEYGELNYLNARNPLPSFYWGSETNMACISEAVLHTKEHGYSHHIQRLMITGNFALVAGLDVKQVQEWYLAVYIDAYEWVEMPNTLGMALFGDGGIMASKPYAASGKYINKMSNFCKKCYYDPEEMLNENACPFNSLYWDFLMRNRESLQANQRLYYVFNTLDKFSESKKIAIREKANSILEMMRNERL